MVDKIEVQPKFPIVDLTEPNAQILSLLLGNKLCVVKGHSAAEFFYPIFTQTHPALKKASNNIFPETAQVTSVNLGIGMFEAIMAYVQPDPPTPSSQALTNNIPAIQNPKNSRGVAEYFEDSYSRLCTETPLTAAVIRESAGYFRADPHLAAVGGGIARMFELNNIEQIEV